MHRPGWHLLADIYIYKYQNFNVRFIIIKWKMKWKNSNFKLTVLCDQKWLVYAVYFVREQKRCLLYFYYCSLYAVYSFCFPAYCEEYRKLPDLAALEKEAEAYMADYYKRKEEVRSDRLSYIKQDTEDKNILENCWFESVFGDLPTEYFWYKFCFLIRFIFIQCYFENEWFNILNMGTLVYMRIIRGIPGN